MRRALAVVVLLLAACSKAPPPGFERLELATAPSSIEMPISLGYVFGDALELLGAKVTPRQGLRSGVRVDVTLFWRKRAAVPSGFRLFTHVLDGAGERILTLDVAEGLRKSPGGLPAYPPSAWREGKVYIDSFSFWVPHGVRTDSISVVCGLFRERERMPITSLTPKPLRGDRALVAKLGVTLPPVTTPANIPNLWVPRRRGEIVIDGKLDDEGWLRSASTGSFVNVATGEASTADEVSGNAKLTYDEQALYVGFEVFDEDLRGGFDPAQPDPHLWTKDTVEIMVDPDGDGDNLDYYEIQVGPQNLVFDSEFDAYNAPHTEPDGPYGHQDWSAKLTSAVALRGTLDNAHDDDEGYVVELSIPWSSFSKAKRVPPTTDDVWRMNFYAMQNNSGSAWSPILGQGNFHKASRFGRVHFVPPISAIR